MSENVAKNESNVILDFITYQIRDELNSLKSDEKPTRLNAIKSLRRKINGVDSQFSKDEYQNLVNNIYKSILKLFGDSSEKCREHAVNLTITFLSNVDEVNDYLTYLFPILVQRLGNVEMIETSEEVRFLEIQLISLIVDKYAESLHSYIDDIILILKHLIVDPYPEVKKESCNCAANLALIHKKHFYQKSDELIEPILKTLKHQHSKVRSAAIKALKIVILNGSNKMVGDVITHLAQRLFDSSPLVRRDVTELIGTWLCELPDRYSFFSKLIPLCLSLLNDEVEEISHIANKYWQLAGDIYLKENEEKLKDQIDFEKHVAYPDNIAAPSQGCRFLVQRHVYYIIPGITNDLNDWNGNCRLKVAQILLPLVLHCENKISFYIEKLLPALISATKDPDLVTNIKKCAYYIGFFVDSPVWMKVIVPYLRLSPGVRNFYILACLVAGSRHLSDIPVLCDTLEEFSKDTDCLPGIEECVQELMQKPNIPGLPLFLLIVTFQAHGSPNSDILLDNLASYLDLDSPQQLYPKYMEEVLGAISVDFELWTVNTANFLVFVQLLHHLHHDFPQNANLAFDILGKLLSTSTDPKLKLRLFTTFVAIMPDLEKHCSHMEIFDSSMKHLIISVIMPNLEWKAGLTASALRNAAAASLWSFIDNVALRVDFLQQCGENLLVQLVSLLEDDAALTRKFAVLSLTKLYPTLGDHVELIKLAHVYPEVIKRLDDVNNEVRLLAAHFFPVYFHHFPTGFDVQQYQSFYEDICRGLLIHLDDADVQTEILEVLKSISPICPGLLCHLVEQVKHKHRTAHFCSALQQHIQALPNK